ncbi:MAG: hypothetical protein JKX92_12350 [Porticoccaceae bacterium]|nr:hypothetical protein [Porticoccaceae bacterium]
MIKILMLSLNMHLRDVFVAREFEVATELHPVNDSLGINVLPLEYAIYSPLERFDYLIHDVFSGCFTTTLPTLLAPLGYRGPVFRPEQIEYG